MQPPTGLSIDASMPGQTFHGIGAISGGGATSRLLVDYPEPQRSQVLDYLFKPNYGASLHILKVEIGGDSQSTDGTESSHMHSEDDLDYNRGYEWWLLQEAKKRNPDIKTYGLPWAYPGWVGGPELSGDPFKHPDLTSKYILKWLVGARDVYGVDIDYIGIWNERASNAKYATTLRRELDAAGFGNTTIVAKDGGADICKEMATDPDYQKAVGIVGLHYPSDFEDLSECRKLGYGTPGGKPMWASEESSSYDDLNGAACWARVITSHWVLQGLTSSIMWDLVGSYFHGTNWYASSLMTAVQPWSGFYTVPEVVWATAHLTQFTKAGWKILENGHGSGTLPQGGFYATYTDPTGSDWSLMIVKIDADHASCTRPSLPSFNVTAENVTFQLAAAMGSPMLAVWHSNFEAFDGKGQVPSVFQRLLDIQPVNGAFTLRLEVGDVYTVSTILAGPTKGEPAASVPASQPQVPLPYFDDFEKYPESQEGKWWSDQIGAFEVHMDGKQNKVMRQMVPVLPIGWNDQGSKGPVSVLGMREWEDLNIAASFRLPADAPASAAACIGTRTDQMWFKGVVLCVAKDGSWSLANEGPQLNGKPPSKIYATGHAPALPSGGAWTRLSLTTVADRANATLDPCGPSSCTLFEGVEISDFDTGFAAIGASSWYAVEFDDVFIAQAGPRWQPPPARPAAHAGCSLDAKPCAPNGFVDEAQAFELLADWGLRHVTSGLCAQARSAAAGAAVSLATCNPSEKLQQFRNDYTNVRNGLVPFSLGDHLLSGNLTGMVGIEPRDSKDVAWQSWTYFPNTQQLRNQYVSNEHLGYPLCLSVLYPMRPSVEVTPIVA